MIRIFLFVAVMLTMIGTPVSSYAGNSLVVFNEPDVPGTWGGIAVGTDNDLRFAMSTHNQPSARSAMDAILDKCQALFKKKEQCWARLIEAHTHEWAVLLHCNRPSPLLPGYVSNYLPIGVGNTRKDAIEDAHRYLPGPATCVVAMSVTADGSKLKQLKAAAH